MASHWASKVSEMLTNTQRKQKPQTKKGQEETLGDGHALPSVGSSGQALSDPQELANPRKRINRETSMRVFGMP